jgi:hypothetical protein
LQKYLPLADPCLRSLQFLDPANSKEMDETCAVFVAKEMHFSEEDVSALICEWRLYSIDERVEGR